MFHTHAGKGNVRPLLSMPELSAPQEDAWFDALSQPVRSVVAGVPYWAGAKARRGPRLRSEHVEDFPDFLKPDKLYITREEPHLWAGALECPCGRGAAIHLNLLEDASPSWTLWKHRDGSVTGVAVCLAHKGMPQSLLHPQQPHRVVPVRR